MYFNKVDINRIEQHFFRESGENEIYMVLLAEEDMFFATALVDLFNMHQAVFMGGVFPYLISQGDLKEQGVIINRLPGGGKCFFLEGPEPSMEEVAPMVDYIHEFRPETAFIFADGMSPYNSGIISSVYRYLGTSVRYFGAGAGTMDYVQKPVVFCSDGLIGNGVTIMFSGREMQMSVKHGWEKHKGPLMITQAEGNVIHKLNWQNAFEVYRRELGKQAAKMTPQSFSNWGQKHYYP